MKTNLYVLLTNDDGFYADGLQTLYNHVKEIAAVTIVAPDQERSAVGHGITMHQPLRVKKIIIDNIEHWMVNGTPSDCIKLAVEQLLKDRSPDLIISGINRGPNLGCDILYSGTVSAAIEGTLHKIPSIAASSASYGKINFSPAAVFIRQNLPQLSELARISTLNINFPAIAKTTNFKGARFTKLGIREYQNVFEERKDPRGETYYWMGGEPIILNQEKDSDITAVEEGYVSITPLHLNLTDTSFLEQSPPLPKLVI